MPIQVHVDTAASYELVVSFTVFLEKQHHKTLELGRYWAAEVHASLSESLRQKLSHKPLIRRFMTGAHYSLILQCPERSEPDRYLNWLSGLSVGEVFERLTAQSCGGDQRVSADLGSMRDEWVDLLADWNDQYFRHLEPGLLNALVKDAEEKRAWIGTLPAHDVLARATSGFRLNETQGVQQVVLIPQYHFRPWNVYEIDGPQLLCLYPAEVVKPVPGEPSPALLRLTQALADESRLKILYDLAGGPKHFTEIVATSGLTKGTVHHHLVALRAAGLVQVEVMGDNHSGSYTLNPNLLDEVASRLGSFLRR